MENLQTSGKDEGTLKETKSYSKAAGQTDSQVDASQRKFEKPELAYGLAKGGQTDSQVGSQVAKAVNFTHIIS